MTKKTVLQAIECAFVGLSMMMLSGCNRQRHVEQNQNEVNNEDTINLREKERAEKLDAVAMQIESVMNGQDSIYQIQIKNVKSQSLKRALEEERLAWNELIIPWTTYDNRFNYYQRDAFFTPFSDGWLFFVANLIDKRDSSLFVVTSVLKGKIPEIPENYIWEDEVDYDSIIQDQLKHQRFTTESVPDSVQVTDNFLKAWTKFAAARRAVANNLPTNVRQAYTKDTRRWYELALCHLEEGLSFRGMEIEEIWHRPILLNPEKEFSGSE